MKILFDQSVPMPLAEFFKDHSVSTAFELGWSRLTNGKLLDSAENSGFELLVTFDKNIRFQQNLESRKISILVLPTTS